MTNDSFFRLLMLKENNNITCYSDSDVLVVTDLPSFKQGRNYHNVVLERTLCVLRLN